MILKRIFAIFALAVLMLTSACSITKEVEAKAVPIAFTEMNNYYVKNGVNTNKPLRKIINTESEFRAIFGEAAYMGSNGSPTPINFNRQFVLAVVNPVTNRQTQMFPLSVLQNGKAIIFNYQVEKGAKMDYYISPYVAVVLDRPTTDATFEIYWNEK